MKRIYIAPDDHTDYMWTADEETYRQAFLEMLDYYLDQADATADLPGHQQSRWNCDGSLWLWVYERNRSPAAFGRLIGRIKSGHITAPLPALPCCYGAMPAEAALRGMYYAGGIERRHGVRFPLALTMENQTMPYGLGALFAGAGARYLWHGICDCATPLVGHFNDREHPLYWWVGPDGSRLLVKWYPLLKREARVGQYLEARNLPAALELVESAPFRERYPYDVVGLFGYGEDDLKTFSTEWTAAARDLTTAERRVIVSNEVDFFEDVERSYGDALPDQACAFGNDWDLWSSALAEEGSRVKRAVERLRPAEAMTTLVGLHDPDFLRRGAVADVAARDGAWLDLGLYYEHNWITGNKQITPAERTAWQRRLAEEIERYVARLHDDASAALGNLITGEEGRSRFYVFNPLSWPRTDVADVVGTDALLAPQRPSRAPAEPDVHVVDLSTGAETPSQFVTVDGKRSLRILARDVPPLGYKTFEVRPGKGAGLEPAARVGGDGRLPGLRDTEGRVFENDRYRLVVTPRGAISSLVDRQRGDREFVSPVEGRGLNDLGLAEGELAVENAGPVSVTLRATSPHPLRHTSRITLVRDSGRIDIRNDIEQNFDAPHTWTFAFRTDSPELWHEEVGAVIRAALLDGGGHYSPRNARYDWLTLNHFADRGGAGAGVTLSNADCAFMRAGDSTALHLDADAPHLSVLAGGNVSGAHVRIRDQGGETHFRQQFALQTRDAFDPAAAMRFALEHQNPLVARAVTGPAGAASGSGGLPATGYGLLTISNPEVLLWALKPAEEGMEGGSEGGMQGGSEGGIIARVWNLSPEPQRFTLSMATGIAGAGRVTHVETDLGAATVEGGVLSAAMAPSQLSTFRILPAAGPPAAGATADAALH